ncbi:MAG TPA: hypothetical protein VGR63_18970 [Casimicrobiaceae bacterium]|jgi:hypothetical protein|nr:hypothetical protein [Casimicrobiaceae bacterium]
MSAFAVFLLALAFLFVMLIRWASQSIPRAIIFVALLCASPYALAVGLGVLAAIEESQQHKVMSRR